jgi:hypothetical protein
MRTTIDIEDDVLAAAKELARLQNVSAGQVVSRLLREALVGLKASEQPLGLQLPGIGGFRPFSAGDKLVTNDLVNRLRDQEGV